MINLTGSGPKPKSGMLYVIVVLGLKGFGWFFNKIVLLKLINGSSLTSVTESGITKTDRRSSEVPLLWLDQFVPPLIDFIILPD